MTVTTCVDSYVHTITYKHHIILMIIMEHSHVRNPTSLVICASILFFEIFWYTENEDLCILYTNICHKQIYIYIFIYHNEIHSPYISIGHGSLYFIN